MSNSTSNNTAGSVIAKAISTLLTVVLVSAGAGILASTMAFPAVKATSSVTDESVAIFDALPSALEEKELSQQSRMWAADGSLLATFYFRNRIVVDLADINEDMQQAMVAIEDSRFYEHGGVDLQGVGRAAVSNFTEDGLQGASTLTQQYVKNVLISQADAEDDVKAINAAKERSYGRKLREMKLAIAVEQRLEKDEILERYLNIAQFGASQYGVEAAARYYFDSTAADLTLAEAATLAGVTQSPNALDPELNPEDANAKRNTVLSRMLELGFISQDEYDEAREKDVEDMLDIRPTSQTCVGAGKKGNAAYFCDYVTKVITHDETFGETREERWNLLYRGGLDIYTTLDPKMQDKAQKEVLNGVPRKDPSGVAAAIVTVEPGTGEIKSMAQNRTYRTGDDTKKGETTINYSTDNDFGGSKGFQPGSTFKPFVLAAWLDSGKSLNERVNANMRSYAMSSWDASCIDGNFTGEAWTPRNDSDGDENGNLSILDATARSVNTGYAAMANQLDLCDIRDVAEKTGFHRADDNDMEVFPSMILGTQQTSPLTMATSFATFAAEGTHCDPVAITKITDANDEELPVPEANCRDAIDSDVANAVSYALTKGFTDDRGTAKGHSLNDREAAGKTGTTNEAMQSWFVGYTPQLSSAVWVGHSDGNKSMKNTTINGQFYPYVYGSSVALPIWQKYMDRVMEDMPKESFPDIGDRQLHGERKDVPNVVSYELDSAEKILKDAGFKLGKVSEGPSDEYQEGAVISSNPRAGHKSRPGSSVDVTVSNGDSESDDDGDDDEDDDDEDDD